MSYSESAKHLVPDTAKSCTDDTSARIADKTPHSERPLSSNKSSIITDYAPLTATKPKNSWCSLPIDVLTLSALVVLWLSTRALMLWLYAERYRYIVGDVAYYFNSLQTADNATLSEYPLPAVWLLRLVRLISGDNFAAFELGFGLLTTACDLAAIVLLARRSKLAAGYWILFTAAIGPLIWVRLDIIIAFLVCASLTLLTKSDHTSGAAMAFAAGFKMWPAALIAPIISPNRAGMRRLIGFAVVGLALGSCSLLLGGWARNISPLTWQSERGLQIEAVSATWPMILHALPDRGYTVSFTSSNAYEVFGTAVPFWLQVSQVAFLVTWVIIIFMSGWLCWQQRKQPTNPAVAHRVLVAQVATVLATILLLIAVNKTLSPQYMFWLAGPLAFGISLPHSPAGRFIAYIGGSVALTSALLTQAVYPITYTALVQPYLGDTFATALLVIRNLTVLGMALGSVPLAFTTARRIVR
ncbi:MAG: hypothetical protein LBJ43_02080 [Propionibacteriaceae bacterium]|jgi:hypothetical protein|nr:hypothetical protein [Propionibacteriaceae bacterium]